ncbi:hypothetical protein Pint_01147 [Pistacia integerrima]|uniref:Uncharacterized protein n=1 Tax=Pistacia integerrima TaxID=434235 RepID=A0ACC0ZJI3_9ROSI|nr:hypothetical protein Pint_01147 [Pistacia integerrima]
MACRGCLECLLKLLNLLLTLVGLAMVGYGIYLFVEYKRAEANETLFSPVSGDETLVQLGRPMLMAVSLSSSIFDKLPKACLGKVHILIYWRRSGSLCHLLFWLCWSYNTEWMLPDLCILIVELGCAAFLFFDKSWKDEIPTDKTGYFDMIYDFLKEHWTIVKWVALGIVVLEPLNNEATVNLQALIFLLALVVRAANRPVEYDSDDELIAPRQQIRQPLLNRPPAPATGVPVAGALDQRPSRNDAWSTRMREKYGLDTSEFTYNPSESHRFQPVAPQQSEERSRCTIM